VSDRAVIAVVVAAALAIRISFAWVVPVFQAPDEEAHFRYVEYLGVERALPIQPERSLELFADPMHQAYQPPLAYASLVPVDRAFAAAGASLRARLRAVRLQNALFGAATVWLGALVAIRLTRRGDPRRLLTALALAFLPGFVAVGAAANNDSLANLLAAALWLTLIPHPGPAQRSRASEGRGRGKHAAWWSGVVFGAACLAKLSNLALAPLLLAVPLLRERGDLRGALRFAAIALATAGVVMLPWMAHNVVHYGSPLAIGSGSLAFDWLESIAPGAELEGLRRARYGNAFFQFFGRFGIANNLSWVGVPLALVPLALFAATGWLRRRPDASERVAGESGSLGSFDGWAPAWLLAAALATAALVQFSLAYAGAWQGRYLYSAMLPWALLFAGGLARWLPGDRRGEADARRATLAIAAVALLLVLTNLLALSKLAAFFAETPPGRWIFSTRL
jgi:hypothetical protein